MRKIKYFDNELSIEEYIKMQICKNAGTQSFAYKDQLCDLCEKMGITYSDKLKKDELFDLLITNGCDYTLLAQKYGVGVSSKNYQDTFAITHKDVKRLEKKGILKVVGEYRFRAYGKYMYAPLYDIFQFASISEEVIKNI
ncbi:hypothetical protein [uncultured Eubacterium sp.]|uniref:hypothetical protein n=1 Tax=uncultured Eubacterium sp. TaxID=165185 RepID=UPI003264D591